jgi:hypothetical protein
MELAPLARASVGAEAALQKRLEDYWGKTAYVTDEETVSRMRAHLRASRAASDAGDPESAWEAYFQAKREFLLARKNRRVYYRRSWLGMKVAMSLLLLSCALLVAVYIFGKPEQTWMPVAAGLAGAVGGCVSVLLQVIDVDPSSEAVSMPPWFVIKPSLGAALGVVTYFAVSLGVGVLSDGSGFAGVEGAAVIGFLAGFFESFSKGVFARIAGRLGPGGGKDGGEADH